MPFFFGDSTDLFQGYSFMAANHDGRVAFQKAMMNYLVSFVNTGNTNAACAKLPEWSQWSNAPGDPEFIRFDADLNDAILTMDPAEATPGIVGAERAAYIAIGGAALNALWQALGI